MRILLTRPEPDAARTAAKLRAAGHEVTVDSLLTIEPVNFDPPRGDYDALAITSGSAPRVIRNIASVEKLKSLPLFAVGARTAEVAREAGFTRAENGGGDARALGETLARKLAAGSRVLYLAGERRARDLAAMAAPAKIAVETLVVYRARPAAKLQPATTEMLGARAFDAILHFSPRSAEILVALVTKAGLAPALTAPRHLCLSAVAAAALPDHLRKEVAARPEEDALLALLDR